MTNKLSETQKITFAAMLILLDILLTHVIKTPRIPGLGFISISLGPSIVIYASLILGPFYGAIVGGLGDLIGIALFTGLEGTINPIMTVMCILLGVLPYYLLQITKRIKHKNIFYIVYIVFVLIVLILLSCSFYVIPSTMEYLGRKLGSNTIWVYPTVLSVTAALDLVSIIGLFYFGKRRDKNRSKDTIYGIPSFAEVAFISLICEILLLVFCRAGAMVFYFRVLAARKLALGYWIIVICMLTTSSLSVILNTYLTSMFLRLSEDRVLKQISRG